MYTSGPADQPAPARGCTRSRSVDYAGEDLQFPEAYMAGSAGTHVEGTVQFQRDGSDDDPEKRTPLNDVGVKLVGGVAPIRAKSTASGKYLISNVAPATYSVDAESPGYSLEWKPESVKVVPHGCAEADLLMKVDRTVQGTVLDYDGEPVRNAFVQMMSLTPGLKAWEQPTLLDVSAEQGHYSITGIPPGDYLLGININSKPTTEYPFLRTYYPNAPVSSEAKTSHSNKPFLLSISIFGFRTASR